MKNIDTLFICKANVWRSQIAEWFYNTYSQNTKSISLAWVEARKEKYNWKPSTKIISLMQKKGINVSNKTINYINDFIDEVLFKVDKIVFLYKPNSNDEIDDECKIGLISPYDYLKLNFNWEILIFDIKDPFWKSNKSIEKIINQIEKIVKELNI